MGSEMCIRDRGMHLSKGMKQKTMICCALLHDPDVLLFDEPLIGLCLLYTSDAADERSSVDLGGRRIIKKKTRTNRGVTSRLS